MTSFFFAPLELVERAGAVVDARLALAAAVVLFFHWERDRVEVSRLTPGDGGVAASLIARLRCFARRAIVLLGVGRHRRGAKLRHAGRTNRTKG